MKYRVLILTLFHTVTMLSQKKDSLEIVQLLKEDYSTLQTFDISKHKECCTNNYLLSEDGNILRMDDEVVL